MVLRQAGRRLKVGGWMAVQAVQNVLFRGSGVRQL